MKNKFVPGVLVLSLLCVPFVQSAQKDCGAAAAVASSAQKTYTIKTKDGIVLSLTSDFINQFETLTDFLDDENFEDDNEALLLAHVTEQDIDFLKQIIDAQTQEAIQTLLDQLSLQELIHITHLAVYYLGIKTVKNETRELNRARIIEDFLAPKLWTPQEGVDPIAHYEQAMNALKENPSGCEQNLCYKQLKNAFLTIKNPQLAHAIQPGEYVISTQFSPDGRYVVTALPNRTAQIYNTQTKEVIHTITPHDSNIYSAQFSPDGCYLVAASWSKTAIYDIQTCTVIHTIRHGSSSAQFSPDGRYVVTASNKAAKIYDTLTRTVIHTIQHDNEVTSAQFSSDGRYVVTASKIDHTAKIYDTVARTVIHTIAHASYIRSAQFSPDGRYVVTASEDRTAKIYDTLTRTVIHTIAHTGLRIAAQFSLDSRYVVTASVDCTKIYDTLTRTVIHTITHGHHVTSAQFSPDSRYVVTASSDRTVQIYDTQTGTVIHTIAHDFWVDSAQFSPDGRYVFTTSHDKKVRIYDLYTQQQKDFLDNEKKPHEDKKMYSSIDILRLRQKQLIYEQEEQLRQKQLRKKEELRQEQLRQEQLRQRIQQLKNSATKILVCSAYVAGGYGLYKWFTEK